MLLSLLAAQQGQKTDELRMPQPRTQKRRSPYRESPSLLGVMTVKLDNLRVANQFWNNLLHYEGYTSLQVENAVWTMESRHRRSQNVEEITREIELLIPGYEKVWKNVNVSMYGDNFETHPKESFNYIPLHRDSFVTMRDLFTQLGERPRLGVDLGAGKGNGVLHLPLFCQEAEGIEINQEYIDHAPAALRPKIKQGDIFTADLSEYDLLYFYRPLQNYEAEKRFEDGLAARMKPGAFLVPMYSNHHFPDLRLMAINPSGGSYHTAIYQKPYD